MKKRKRNTVIKELIWLFLIMVVSALVELFIIELFNLHPVLGVKIQGFIGLLIIGYAIRMFSRIRHAFIPDPDHKTNGQKA